MNPWHLIALKQKVGPNKANEIGLLLLIYLDCVHRGQGIVAAENALIRLVVMAQIIGSHSANRPFFDIALEGGRQLLRACGRRTELLSFTTGEYKAVARMLLLYLRALPNMEVAMLMHASLQADQIIQGNLPTT